MDYVGHMWRVRDGFEYDRRHARIWPELAVSLSAAGVRAYHIYRHDLILFSHLEVDDYPAMVAVLASDPVAVRWEEEFADLVEYPPDEQPTAWPGLMTRVWSFGPPDFRSRPAE